MALKAKNKRRGGMAVELLFVFPILLAVLLGTVEFSLWLSAQQQVALASREGARTAATGGGKDAVNLSVRRALGDTRFNAAEVVVNLADDNGDPVAPGDPVAVQVRLPAGAVVPDLLRFIGLSIQNEVLVGQTVMRKE
ncbi:MAG: TadE family protein [Gemmataceae bacterium]